MEQKTPASVRSSPSAASADRPGLHRCDSAALRAQEEKLEESLMETFPASDPPSWISGHIGIPDRQTPMKSRRSKRTVQFLGPGAAAPDFTLPVTPDQNLALSDLKGKPIILAFYPADWSPVCGDQMTVYNEILSEFHKHGAELLGLSVDGVWCHQAFVKDRRLHFPLLADFEPKGEVARKYGAYRNQEGVSERALFVIDRSGVIFWSYLSPIAVNPGADGILDALERLSNRVGGSVEKGES
jgi:peroxiredoxin